MDPHTAKLKMQNLPPVENPPAPCQKVSSGEPDTGEGPVVYSVDGFKLPGVGMHVITE